MTPSKTLHPSLVHFWNKYPAFQCGSAFLIGVLSSFHIAYLLLALLFQKRFSYLLITLGYLYCFVLYPAPRLSQSVSGTGIFQIKEIKRHPSPFASLLVYEGTLRAFHTENETFHRLPCQIYIPTKKKRPLGTHDYIISGGTLRETGPHCFILKTNKHTVWTPLKTKSLSEQRFQAKEKVRAWIKKHFREKSVKHLIAGLLTGQKENRLQLFQFGQIGLQHLLAISGFHFAILTFFLAFLLRRFLPRKIMACTLILLLSAYFLYMGEAPSISRAWIGVVVFLGGTLFQRKSSPLNALGVGLLAALLANPLIVLDVGFKLSFAATFGILLFYSPSERQLRKHFPKRTMTELKQLPLLDQWGSLLSTYLRKVLALNFSVLLFTLPVVLFHFHKFPLISLLYNLFFPLLFSLLISLLLFSFLFPFLLSTVEAYSHFLLLLVSHAPKKLMFCLRFSNFPQEIACLMLLAFFLWGVYLHWSSSVIKEWQLT